MWPAKKMGNNSFGLHYITSVTSSILELAFNVRWPVIVPKKVFVSGCFDMLHSGHVAFLEEAARLGDLYVGIGSDRTIMELKNRAPVNPEAERLYMLKALRCVKEAWVSSGSGIMDFQQEVLALKPDYFFVNTDGYSLAK